MADHYCVLSDVQALVPQTTIDGTSRPSAVAVTALIEQVAQRLDATIGNVGYVVPVVSGTKALGLLREACAWGTAGLMLQIRESAVSVAINDRGQPAKNLWTRSFEEWVARLVNPQDSFELPDAPRTTEQLEKQPETVLRSFVQGVTDDPDYSPDAPTIARYQTL